MNQDLEIRLKELDDHGSYPAVTLLMPLHTLEDDDLGNPDQTLKDLIVEVRQKIAELPDSPAFQTISKKLNKLPVKLPPINFYKGFAAFVSADHEEVIPLDFSVEKKAYIGQNFQLQDIFRLNNIKNEMHTESDEEKIKRIIIERLFEFRPYCKRTY